MPIFKQATVSKNGHCLVMFLKPKANRKKKDFQGGFFQNRKSHKTGNNYRPSTRQILHSRKSTRVVHNNNNHCIAIMCAVSRPGIVHAGSLVWAYWDTVTEQSHR